MALRFLLFLCCSASFAQQPPAATAKGSVEGQVVSASGEPVRKAQVTLRSTDQRNGGAYLVTTDTGGMFAFPDVDPGSYRASAERAGFVRGEYGARSGGTVQVDSGQKVTGVLIRLTPQAVITGRVVDEDGDPVAGASVSVMRYSYARGRRQLVSAGGNMSDDQGEYRIHSLPPGRYYVSANWRPAMWGRGTQVEETFAPTYYPNAADITAAAPLAATAGSVLRGVDIHLARKRTVTVSGKVVHPAGRPLARGAFVYAAREGTGTWAARASGTVQPDGTFFIRGVLPGSYILVAEAREDTRRLTARQPVAVPPDGAEGVVLALAARGAVSGRVRIDGPGERPLAGVAVYLEPHDDSPAAEALSARVKADGSFTIENIAPEPYTVSVSGMPEGCYLASVRFGNEDALANGLDLTRGAAAPVEIVLSPAAGSVDVAVLDSRQQPAAGAAVVAVPEEPARRDSLQWYHSGTTDQSGRVTLKNLAPGEYRLYAWEDVEAYVWMDAEMRRPFAARAQSLSVRENGRESAQLAVIPAGAGE